MCIHWSLSCGWIEIIFNFASCITVCICYLHVKLLESLPRELHFLSQSVSLQTVLVMWTLQLSVGVYYLREHILFECLGENVGLHSVMIPKRFLKIRFSCLWHTDCVSYSLHMIVQIWQKFCSAIRPQEYSQWQLPFYCRLHLLIRKYSWCIQ
jgi:hypothetical protein